MMSVRGSAVADATAAAIDYIEQNPEWRHACDYGDTAYRSIGIHLTQKDIHSKACNNENIYSEDNWHTRHHRHDLCQLW